VCHSADFCVKQWLEDGGWETQGKNRRTFPVHFTYFFFSSTANLWRLHQNHNEIKSGRAHDRDKDEEVRIIWKQSWREEECKMKKRQRNQRRKQRQRIFQLRGVSSLKCDRIISFEVYDRPPFSHPTHNEKATVSWWRHFLAPVVRNEHFQKEQKILFLRSSNETSKFHRYINV